MSDSSALSSPGSSHSLPLDDSGSLSSAPSSDGGDPTAAGRSDVTNLSPSVVEACAAVALSGPAALSSSSQADRSVHGRCEGKQQDIDPPTVSALPSQAAILPSGPGGFGRHRGLQLLSRPTSSSVEGQAQAGATVSSYRTGRRVSTAPLTPAAVGSPGRPMTRLQQQQLQTARVSNARESSQSAVAAQPVTDQRALMARRLSRTTTMTTTTTAPSQSETTTANDGVLSYSLSPTHPISPARQSAPTQPDKVRPGRATLARLDPAVFSRHRPDTQRRTVSDPTLFDGGLPTAMPELFTARPALESTSANGHGRLSDEIDIDGAEDDSKTFAPGRSPSALFNNTYQSQPAHDRPQSLQQQQIHLPPPNSQHPPRPHHDIFHDHQRLRAVSSPSSLAFRRPSMIDSPAAELAPPPPSGTILQNYPSYPSPYGYHPALAYPAGGSYPYGPPMHAYAYGPFDPQQHGHGLPPPLPIDHPAHTQGWPLAPQVYHPMHAVAHGSQPLTHWRPHPFAGSANGGGWGPYVSAFHPYSAPPHVCLEDESSQRSSDEPILVPTGTREGPADVYPMVVGGSSVNPRAILPQQQRSTEQAALDGREGSATSSTHHARSSSDWSIHTDDDPVGGRTLGHSSLSITSSEFADAETDDFEADVARLHRSVVESGFGAHRLVRMDQADSDDDDSEMSGPAEFAYEQVDTEGGRPIPLFQRRQQRNHTSSLKPFAQASPHYLYPAAYPHGHPTPHGFPFPHMAGGGAFYGPPPVPMLTAPVTQPPPPLMVRPAGSASLAARRKKSTVLRLKLSSPKTKSTSKSSAANPARMPPSSSAVLSGGISKKKRTRSDSRKVDLRPVIVPNLNKPTRGRAVPCDPDEVRKRRGSDSANVYTCPAKGCGRCFARPEHLRRHAISLHTHEKPHACQFAGCNKRFARGDNLKQHFIVVHHRDKLIERKKKVAAVSRSGTSTPSSAASTA